MKNIVTLCLLTLLFSMTTYGQNQFNVINLDTAKLPDKITYTGKIQSAVRWSDKSGDHIVITSETGEMLSKNAQSNDYRDAELFAYHYIVGKDSTCLTWKVYDFIKDCPLDIEARFIKNTFQVTDLNKDGIAEIWLMYQTACRGDVSPCNMKIIMYQGLQKYAMRGVKKVQEGEYSFGGNYKFDNAFNAGPEVFREFAKKLWEDNVLETWGE